MSSRLMSRLLFVLSALVFNSACANDSSFLNCFEVAATPESFNEFGACEVQGKLVLKGEHYQITSLQNSNYVYISDLEYAWSPEIENFINKNISVSGRYQILEGRYPSLIKVYALESVAD